MNRTPTAALIGSFALLCLLPLAQALGSELRGCWRTQGIDQYESGKVRHTNRDCVTEFDAKRIRSECLNPGSFTSVLTYELTGPGKYRAIVEGNEKSEWREFEYEIDDRWLIVTSVPQKRAGVPVPDKIVSLSVRVDPSSGLCRPRGPSKLLSSRGTPSSLAMTAPAGYVPLTTDPSADPALARAINSNFVIGHFTPAKSGPAVKAHYVLLVEDYRSGARPVKSADFRRLKVTLKQQIGQHYVSCEDDKTLCFDTRPSAGEGGPQTETSRYMTTTFVNVQGRVAIIYALVIGGPEKNQELARRSANVFAAQILDDSR
jgi:hypothetical protein